VRTISSRLWEVSGVETAWLSSKFIKAYNKKAKKSHESVFSNCTLDQILTSILKTFGSEYIDFAACYQLKEILEQLFPQLDASTVNLPLLDTSLYEQYIEEWNAENLSAKELYGMENLASEHVPKS
jgi:hypothetical protein